MYKITLFFCFISMCQYAFASKEIIHMLDLDSDLTVEQKSALQPLFLELQKQYDYIINEANQNRDSMDTKYMMLYDSTQKEFEAQYETLLKELETPTAQLDDIEFFNVRQLIDFKRTNRTDQEANDIQNTMMEFLDELQRNVDDLERLSGIMGAALIEINKPEVAAKIYNAIKTVYFAAVRVSRAAYCTYSYSPQLSASLHNINNGVNCFKHILALVQAIRHEITLTLQAIRVEAQDLAKIFKDIQGKTSIVSKILAIVRNASSIKSDIDKITATVKQLGDKWESEMPSAANGTKECAVDFITALPQVVDTVLTVTRCIIFVDDSTVDYDFMKPEEEDDRDYD